MKKSLHIVFLVTILFTISFISAINLDISVKPIRDSYITDLNEPAQFELIIKNLGVADSFEIYSIVGIDITPKEAFNLSTNSTKTLKIDVVPQEALRTKKGFLTFEYLIKNSHDEIQTERLSINIVSLDEAIVVDLPNLNPRSETLTITVKNTIAHDFEDLKLKFESAFFVFEKELPLNGLELKEFNIPIDSNKLKSQVAGKYIVDVRIMTQDKVNDKEVMIKFLEEENIETSEYDEGILLRRIEITKNNLGNVKKFVDIKVDGNIFTNLFTTYNLPPTEVQRKGIKKYYIWARELNPGEQYKIIIKTNWLYPIFIVILIVALIVLVNMYLKTDLTVRKNVYFVKTKGGEFALRVHIKVKAKRFCERIKISDKIPPLVSLYERFGAVPPDKVDIQNKRVEWNIETLNPGEERVFSYIIYSKIGVVGKFELPPTKAMYEREGVIKDTFSNKAFYINEPVSQRM